MALTGYHRKHAVRRPQRKCHHAAGARRGRRCVYDAAVTEGLIVLWEASDRMCGKRLKALLPTLVPALEHHGHLSLDPAVRERLLAVSAATIDRRLASARARDGRSTPAPALRAERVAGAACRYVRSAIGRTRLRVSSRQISSRTAAGRCPAVSSGRWC